MILWVICFSGTFIHQVHSASYFEKPIYIGSNAPFPGNFLNESGAFTHTEIINHAGEKIYSLQAFTFEHGLTFLNNTPLYKGEDWGARYVSDTPIYIIWKYARPISITKCSAKFRDAYPELNPEKIIIEVSNDGIHWEEHNLRAPYQWYRMNFIRAQKQTAVAPEFIVMVQEDFSEPGFFGELKACIRLYPLLAVCAAVFYILIIGCVWAPFRTKFLEIVEMPTPSTHSLLVPLDSLRGFAALGIFLFHLWQWPAPLFEDSSLVIPWIAQGRKCVPLFVLLSGFLIYRSLKKLNFTKAELRAYAIRRFLRIYPLYIIMVATYFLVCPAEMNDSIVHRIPSEILMLRILGDIPFFNPAAWSLYVEVTFYMILPIIVASLGRYAWVFALIFIVCSGIADPLIARATGKEMTIWKYFAFGILTCEIHDRFGENIPKIWTYIVFAAGIVLMQLDFNGFNWFGGIVGEFVSLFPKVAADTIIATPFDTVGFGVAACLVLLGSIHCVPARWFFSLQAFRVLGTISYSLFLWHMLVSTYYFPQTYHQLSVPGLDWRSPLWIYFWLVTPAMIFISIISFILIEKPFLSLRPKNRSIGTSARSAQKKQSESIATIPMQRK